MSKERSSRLYLVLATLAFALVLSALAYRTISLLNVPGAPDKKEWGMQDFRDAMYYPAVAFLDGRNPYDTPNYVPHYPVRNYFPLYSPITLMIHAPLGLLPYEAAELVYYVGIIVTYLLTAYLALKFCGIKPHAWKVLGITTLILMSRPGHNNLVLGQCAALAVLFSLVAIQYARSKPALSGVSLALATFKPTFGVPIFILMLFRRDFRACAIAVSVGTVATLVVVGILAANAGGVGPFVESMTSNNTEFDGRVGSNPATSFSRIDAIAVLGRLTGWNLSTAKSFMWGIGIMVLAGLAMNRVPKSLDEAGATGLSGAIICLATLVCIYHQPPDVMLMTVTFLAVATAYGRTWSNINAATRWALIACLAVPAANYLATASFIRVLKMEGAVWTAVMCINGVALTTAFAICMGLAFRRRGAVAESIERPDGALVGS